MQQWNQTVAGMENALQEVEEQLIYRVSFKVFWDSFWFQVDAATVIIDFQPDIWTVAYAYSSRSYLYTGHHNDRHTKSGAQLTFLQRFAGAKTLVRAVGSLDSKMFMIERHGNSRQIPINSLNVKQVEENKMLIDMSKWFYHLSEEQLNQIYFTCNNNQEEFDEQFGQNPALGRLGVSEFANQIAYSMNGDNQQMNFLQSISDSVGQSSQLIQDIDVEPISRKRDVKLRAKVELKEKQQQQVKLDRDVVLVGFISNGSKNGIKRIKCRLCKTSLNSDKWEEHQCKDDKEKKIK